MLLSLPIGDQLPLLDNERSQEAQFTDIDSFGPLSDWTIKSACASVRPNLDQKSLNLGAGKSNQ